MRIILFTLFILACIGCKTNTNNYEIAGTAKGFTDGTKVFLFQLDDRNQPSPIDTLTINNEAFAASFPKVENTPLHILRVENNNANVVFFIENENLKVNLYKDSLGSSKVTGGRENELYSQFIEKSRQFTKQKLDIANQFQKAQLEQDDLRMAGLRAQDLKLSTAERNFKKEFVSTHNNSIFSLMLLSEMFSTKDITENEINDLFAKLNPKYKEHPIAKELQTKMEAAKVAELGAKAPNFEAPTPSGENLSLYSILGKYTIIDFWASWCRPCRMENPNVVKVYNKYHDKGLEIISVSLDREGQKDKWLQAIKDDNMNWHHISNLQFWNDPIAAQFNVRSIPATFLLDENGVIIDKNLRGPALEARIAGLLGN